MKVLVLTGPESSGKSWLAEQLQARFGGRVVGEYVRHFIDEQRRDTCYADIPGECQAWLERHRQPYRAIAGDWAERRRQAFAAVQGLLQDG